MRSLRRIGVQLRCRYVIACSFESTHQSITYQVNEATHFLSSKRKRHARLAQTVASVCPLLSLLLGERVWSLHFLSEHSFLNGVLIARDLSFSG
jgi:hypothetical protein